MSAGTLSQISFGLESSWGTAVVPNKSITVRPGDGIQTNNDVQFIPGIKAQLAKNVSSFKGAARHEGSYEVDFVPGVVGYLLKSVFGSCVSAVKGGETIVYNHTLTENEVKPSLTIEQAVGEIVRRYNGAIVNSFKLSSAKGESVMAAFGIQAKGQASASKISASYETIRPFNFADMLTTNGFLINSVAFDEIESFELEYKNNHGFVHTMGSNDAAFNHANPSEVSGKFDLYMNSDSAAKYTDYLNKTDLPLDFAFTGDAIGVSSNYKFTIAIPKATFKAANYPVTDSYNIVSVEFEGISNNNNLISAVLTNLTANYN
jgi:hypothetical protein